MNKPIEKPTSGQLERELGQSIQALYRDRLGKRPSKVSCQFFNAKVAITLEDSVTKPVKLLAEEDTDLARKVRAELLSALEPELKQVIEQVTEVKVVDFLSDSTLDTGRMGIIAVLSRTPSVRNLSSVPKAGGATSAGAASST